ncbi:MAG: lipid A-modifier LpxR family protein, partial [Gemmatimonas sp.]
MIRLRAAILLLVVSAVRLDAQQLAKAVRISDDNEYFNFWIPPIDRPDNNYTQGLKVSWPSSSVPSFGRRVVCRKVAACGLNIEIGQEMYTPTFDSPAPELGARPYAGFLYGRFDLRAAERHSSRAVSFVVGLTGEPSLAESAQILFHRYFGFRRPQGWKYQLGAEPAFAVSAEQAWRIAPGAAGRFVDFIPTVEVLAGTLRTSARAGGRVRVGTSLDHPWLASSVNRRVAVQG